MIRLLQTLSAKDASEVGGKAANLGELSSLGLQVPPGFVIPASVGSRFLSGCLAQAENLLKAPSERLLFDHANEFRSLALQIPLDPKIEQAVLSAYHSLHADLVSVRSSATMEDSPAMSFAGIFDTSLGISESSLITSVKRCWLSMYAKRARDYCSTNRISFRDLRMGVIIQSMIESDISGVCFTANPISGSKEEFYIEAVWGMGEALASGKVTPDTYIYDVSKQTIAGKRIFHQYRKSIWRDGHLIDTPIESNCASEQKLGDALLHQLATECARIRDHYQQPQDIEFAVKGSLLFFLQSRPITTL